ncbi:hypothetical protein ACWC3X_43320, partial [Streptomyces populi]
TGLRDKRILVTGGTRGLGEQPSASRLPKGCVFADRCPLYPLLDDRTQQRCRTERPHLRPAASAAGHRHACHAR